MSNSKSLPGIISIEYLPAEELTLYPKKFLTPGDTTSAIGDFSKLKLVGLASCTTTPERTNAGLVYTSKVAGLLLENDEVGNKQQNRLIEKFHVYRLTDVYKTGYLVGIDKKPFPEIIFSPANDSAPDGMRAVNFEITWVTTLPPLELVLL